MKKTKRKAVINLIIFFLLLAGGIYMAIAGIKTFYGTVSNFKSSYDVVFRYADSFFYIFTSNRKSISGKRTMFNVS